MSRDNISGGRQAFEPFSDFLTVEELAELLRTTPGAIYVQRHRGVAPASLGVRLGKRILWRRSDIERWWAAQLADAGLS